jgi:S1-C subfamily serine protease
MRRMRALLAAAAILALALLPEGRGQDPFTSVTADVNKRMVKLFGAGGFKGLPSYGTGILVSPRGHILTCNNHILSTQDLRVHLYDGRLFHARLVAREPELDVALVKIEYDVDFLPYFDFDQAVKRRRAEPGDWVLAFSNQFQIATRDEPMSVQRGVVSALAELRGRRGIFDAPFAGEVYFLDAIACNPGAAGGVLASRKGELLGILGRELKNTLSDTWINYAVPIQALADIQREEKAAKVDMATFVREAIAGKYKQSDERQRKREDKGGYDGIVLVVNAVTTTPPYVEEVVPGSPAAQSGLKPDDLIVYVEGELVQTIKGYREVMRQFAPGTEIRLQVQRANRLESIKLKLTEPPRQKAAK